MKVIAVNKTTTKKVIKHWCYDLKGNIKKTFCNLHGNYNSFIPCNNEYSAELNKPQRTQKIKYIKSKKKKIIILKIKTSVQLQEEESLALYFMK